MRDGVETVLLEAKRDALGTDGWLAAAGRARCVDGSGGYWVENGNRFSIRGRLIQFRGRWIRPATSHGEKSILSGKSLCDTVVRKETRVCLYTGPTPSIHPVSCPNTAPTRPSHNQSRTHHEYSHVTILPDENKEIATTRRHHQEISYAPVAPSAAHPRAVIQTLSESPGTHLS